MPTPPAQAVARGAGAALLEDITECGVGDYNRAAEVIYLLDLVPPDSSDAWHGMLLRRLQRLA